MDVHKILLNLADRIEIFERNAEAALEQEVRNARIMGSLTARTLSLERSCDRIDDCVAELDLRLDTVEWMALNDYREIGMSRKLNEQMQRTMERIEKNQKDMMQCAKKNAERNEQEEMKRRQENDDLKDRLRRQSFLIKELQETIRQHESSVEIMGNQAKRRQAKVENIQATPANDEIAINEPSVSESKRSTRLPAQPLHPTAPVTEKLRLRKRKAYTPDDNVGAIEPTEGYNLRSGKVRK